jgi:hypothetical protein
METVDARPYGPGLRVRLKGGAGVNRVASSSPHGAVVPEHIGRSLSLPTCDETIAYRRLSQQAN